MKKILGALLFYLLFFMFIPESRAADNAADIFNPWGVCETDFKDSFKSFCEKNQDKSWPLDIFQDKNQYSDLMTVQAASEYVDENGDGIDDNREILIEGEEEWSGNKTFDDMFIGIMPGAKLTIKAGSMITLRNTAIGVEGKLLVEGTKSSPVIFQPGDVAGGHLDSYSFVIFSGLTAEQIPGDEIVMKHAKISGGSAVLFGTILIGNAKLDLRECSLDNNAVAVYIGGDPREKQVNRTKFFNNDFDVMSECYIPEEFEDIDITDPGSVDASKLTHSNFRYNWWGSMNGPEEKECGLWGFWGNEKCYNKLIGLIDFSHWFSSSDLYDPVIIIPGIMGSSKVGLNWKLDPILHTYDNLVASFEENGYEKGKNLFAFPYEWRNSNVITAGELKNEIEKIKSETGIPRVNLVAHSMGGLVARHYIESDDYQNDVDNLITLGTPHRGAPEAYLKWEAAEGFFEANDKVAKWLFQIEALHAGYINLKKYIQSRVLSVIELLPDYDYLEEANNGERRDYPDGYPQNTFLEALNGQSKLDSLKKVNFFTNVIGRLDSEKTISGFRVTQSSEEGKWEHGMPENFYDFSTDRGIKLGDGDITVPLSSAEGVAYGEKLELDSSHGNLPTKAQCEAIKRLSGKEDCEYINTFKRITKILTFGVLSPVDIQVVAPDGKRAGKDFTTGEILNEIDGAYYTGSENPNEFLTIPDPQDGEYKVLTQGTEKGEYKIEIAKISEDENTGQTKEVTAELFGKTVEDQEKESKIEVSENEITVESSDSIPPGIEIISPRENENYFNNQTLAFNYSVRDDQTPAEKIQVMAYFDNQEFNEKSIDLAFQKLGEHQLRITASDETGNFTEKEIKFNLATNLSAIKDNINSYFNEKLIKKESDKEVLIARVRLIEVIQKMIEKTENNQFMKDKVKKKLIEAFQNQINKHLEEMQDYIQKRSGPESKKGIDAKVSELLLESLEFVKYK